MSRAAIRWEYVGLVAVVAVGLAARLHEANYSFDGDEIVSVQLASKPFSEVVAGAARDTPHPPLHLILLHFWMLAFGASEAAARTLSVMFSGAFLVASYCLLRRLVAWWMALGVTLQIIWRRSLHAIWRG